MVPADGMRVEIDCVSYVGDCVWRQLVAGILGRPGYGLGPLIMMSDTKGCGIASADAAHHDEVRCLVDSPRQEGAA